jgi:hypothetical protein
MLNFAFEYAIRKVQEIQLGLKLNGTHQLVVYADVLADNIHTIKKNRGTLIDASKEVGLEINLENTAFSLRECRSKLARKYSKQII